MGRLLLVVKWMNFAQDLVISVQTKEKINVCSNVSAMKKTQQHNFVTLKISRT